MTDKATEIQSVRDIIRSFLDLPVEALPGAQFLNDDDAEMWGTAWDAIREYMSDSSQFNGEEIRLKADRGGFDGGMNIYLVS